MPPKMTDNDRKILSLAWQCFETQPKVNYKKLAEIGNYKNAASAAACFSQAKKKLLASEGAADADADAETHPETAKTANGKKRARKHVSPPPAAKDESDESDDDRDAHEPPMVKVKLEHSPVPNISDGDVV